MQSSSSSSLLQLVKVWLDKSFLQTTKGAGEILTCLENANVATIIEKLPVENSIFWTRSSSSSSSKKADQNNKDIDNESQHDHILVKVDCDSFVEYVNEFCGDDEDENGSGGGGGGGGGGGNVMRLNSELVKYVRSVKRNAQVTQVTMLVPGFKQFFK
jgi:hypothetical protein